MINPALEEHLRRRNLALLERLRSDKPALRMEETHQLHAELRRIREEFESTFPDPLEGMSCGEMGS